MGVLHHAQHGISMVIQSSNQLKTPSPALISVGVLCNFKHSTGERIGKIEDELLPPCIQARLN